MRAIGRSMIQIFKALQALTVPSGVVFFILLIGLIFLWTKRDRLGKIILTLGVTLYYLFSLDPVATLLLSPLERPYNNPDFEQAEHVKTAVLLTGGEMADVLRASALLRIYREWRESGSKGSRIIISGISPLEPTFDEPGVLRAYLEERGVPLSMIFLDRKPMNTRQSSLTLRHILGKAPFFLVTSAYHMKRSMMEFERLGMKPIPVATDFRTKNHRYTFLSLFPSAGNLIDCDIAFHEYAGMLFYRFTRPGPISSSKFTGKSAAYLRP